MSWLDIHKKRIGNEGGSIKRERERESVEFVRQNFKDSPSYKLMEIDGVPFDTRLLLDKRYNMAVDVETKMLLLLPYHSVERGNIARIDDEDWLVVFFNRMELKPRVHLRFCNEVLKFDNGNEYPCAVHNKLQGFQTVDEFKPINLPANSLQVIVEYNEDTKKMRELDRFIFNGEAFEVQAFDRVRNVYKGVGIIDIIVRKVPLKEDEIEEEVEDLPQDYYIDIEGRSEIEINTPEQYIGEVFLNSVATSEDVTWGVIGDATISQDGIVTGNSKGEITITAEFSYMGTDGVGKLIERTKKVKVVNNDDWGWG